jgi:glycerol uptake facilitator-like aquaporin
MSTQPRLPARALAEGLGTGLLVACVVGSGIAAQQLSPDDVGLQLLQNSTATALALVALIYTFGPVSGAHFNPAVTLAERTHGRIDTSTATVYVAVQVAGGCLGSIAANVMFELPAIEWSTTDRATGAHAFAELVATFGLLTVILGVVHSGRHAAVPVAVAGYIGAAYWFTSSTSFANPAVTVARTLSDSFAGIAPASAPLFVAAQLAGAAAAVAVARILFPAPEPSLEEALDARSRLPQPRPAPGAPNGGQEPPRGVRGHVLD